MLHDQQDLAALTSKADSLLFELARIERDLTLPQLLIKAITHYMEHQHQYRFDTQTRDQHTLVRIAHEPETVSTHTQDEFDSTLLMGDDYE